MEEKSYIDKIVAYAKQKEISYTTHKDIVNLKYVKTEALGTTSFVVLDLTHLLENLHMIFYYSYSDVTVNGGTFSGLFLIDSKINNTVKVQKRFWYDMFSKSFKVGDKQIDKALKIYSENGQKSKCLNSGLLQKFKQFLDYLDVAVIESKVNSVSRIPILNKKSYISLRTHKWITEEKEIDSFIDKGREVLALV